MNKDRVYKIKVEISTMISSVHLAECSCPVGKGPHRSSTHIAARLFALERFYDTYQQEDDNLSCTSKSQVWNQPKKAP